MNIEEKAKAYDEALERAREWKEKYGSILSSDGTIAKDFDSIFPELAENEDEKVRKALIDGVSQIRCKGDITREQMIAYLEKQKYNRMQPIYNNQESFESALDKAWKSYNESGARTVDSCEDNYTECTYAKGFREGYLFGLEKQKACVTDSNKISVDEDEKIRQGMIRFLESEQAEGIFTHEARQSWIAYLLKTPEWVHKGWDDEYMINTVIGRYSLHAEVAKKRGDTHDYNLSKSMENWLRNIVKPLILEKQKDKMTAEEHEIVKVNINGIHGLFPPVGDGKYIDEHVTLDKTAEEKQKEQDKCPEYCVRSHCIGCSIYEKQKEQKDYHKLYEDIAKSEWFKKAYEGKSLGDDDEQKEQKLHLTVSGKEVYKICPRCKSRMIRDDSKVYTSMPPQYGYKCPKCGEMEFDTIMYDNPEMEEQNPADEQFPPLEGLDAIKAKYYDDGFKNGFDEGVESVKPAEWDDYTKTNLGRAIQIIKDARGTLHGYQTDDGIYECDKAIEALEHFLYRGLEIEKFAEWSDEDESFLDSIEEAIDAHYDLNHAPQYHYWLEEKLKQPKEEWSEEDKRIVNDILARLEDLLEDNTRTQVFKTTIKSDIDFLKSLHPQPKQEWSDEDEKTLNAIIDMVGNSLYEPLRPRAVILSWLKSLRPQYHGDVTMTEAYKMGKEAGEASHWKPTEHQMTILKAVKEYVGKGSGYWGEGLGSLIDDLEKL